MLYRKNFDQLYSSSSKSFARRPSQEMFVMMVRKINQQLLKLLSELTSIGNSSDFKGNLKSASRRYNKYFSERKFDAGKAATLFFSVVFPNNENSSWRISGTCNVSFVSFFFGAADIYDRITTLLYWIRIIIVLSSFIAIFGLH